MKNVELVSLRQQLVIAKQAVKDLPLPSFRIGRNYDEDYNKYTKSVVQYRLDRARLSSDVIRIDKLISKCISNNLNK